MVKESSRKTDTHTRHEQQIRAGTPIEINNRIERDTEIRIQYYATQDDETIDKRIQELDEEKDLERVLEANAASLSLLGLALGVAFGRKWLLLPMVVGAFLLNHAVRGWCPPVPAFRRMGVRTREEIDREKFALKALRGDYEEGRKRLRG